MTESLSCSAKLQDVVQNAAIVMMAVPSNGFREVLIEVAKYISPSTPIVSLTKGLERETLMRMSEVIVEVLPRHSVAVLTGPNLAHEILAGQPAATVVACADDEIAKQIQVLLTRPTLRVYTNPEVAS